MNYDGQLRQTAAFGGNTLGANYAHAENAIRKTEVEDEMQRLSAAIDHAGALLDTLTARLSPVLRQVGGITGNKEPSQPEPVLCKLADQVRGRRQAIEYITMSMQRLVNDLEV